MGAEGVRPVWLNLSGKQTENIHPPISAGYWGCLFVCIFFQSGHFGHFFSFLRRKKDMTLLSIVQTINAYLSDYILVILLIAVGLWYSVKTKFVQIR